MTNYQSFDREGLIKAATISAADAGRLVSLYEEYFDLKVVETDVVSEELASSWGASAMAGQPCFVLASSSGTPVYLRIVQNPDMPNYTPLRTFGWNALKICVADVDALYARLQSSPFKIIGPPAELEFSSIIYPMQAVGPEGEVLFLNEVRDNLPNLTCQKPVHGSTMFSSWFWRHQTGKKRLSFTPRNWDGARATAIPSLTK